MTGVSYVTSFADYKAAQKLYLRHRRAARLRFLGWMYGLPLATALGALSMWHESQRGSSDGFGLAAWLTFCAAALTVSVVLLRPWNLRRLYKKMRKRSGLSDDTEAQFSFDENCVVSAIPGRSEGRFYWKAILDFAEDSSIVLLFISKKQFLYIPKRAMSEEQWQWLRAIVQEKMGARLAD